MVLTQDPVTDPMPALFGYTGEQAQELLEGDGYDVVLRPVRECEPLGQVLTTDPQAGQPVERGAPVAVFTATPSGSNCEAQFVRRSDAWEFLDFAISGESAPSLRPDGHRRDRRGRGRAALRRRRRVVTAVGVAAQRSWRVRRTRRRDADRPAAC